MQLLIADDGSEGAAQAIGLAASIAWPEGSLLRVITVLEPRPVTVPGAWPPTAMPSAELEASIAERMNDINRHAIESLRAAGRRAEGVVRRGRAASAVIDEAAALGADLVILGSRGHGQIASLVLGSVSSEVVDHAPCPILVARRPTLGPVVFATDGSPAAATAERILAGWPTFADLPIRVVSVAEVDVPWSAGVAPTMTRAVAQAYAEDLAQARATHQRLADEAAARLRTAGRDARAEMREGRAADEILAAASAGPTGLIVVGSRGNTGLKRLLLGSVARNVVHASQASVLVVRG
jgi:nucleotide-binding universal stress UspA family protein